ncbi:MAG TPA: TIGR02300 family protein [Xanthobacteraceae bacterium]|nr:TIGR02300 family protein [Xanthobacteraceae bacterium]
MAKPGLGTKRLCPHCGAKFYDLSKDPIICPKCGSEVQVVLPSGRGRPDAAARAPAVAEEAELPEAPDAEFVSLEDADAEAAGGKPDGGETEDEEVELEEEIETDDTFLEEDEDEGEDVSDIIGGDIEDEEET